MERVFEFLAVRTPTGWADRAVADLQTLLLDHATLELKAAHQAQQLIWKYGADTGGLLPDEQAQFALVNRMSRLAREELRHFEQVLAILQARGIPYVTQSASGYARTLREHVRADEPARLVDTLIVGALIEARSCERFHALLPLLRRDDPVLEKFYRSLLRSEARHFEDYLSLAETVGGGDAAKRIEVLRAAEAELMFVDTAELRFHSGVASVREPGAADMD